MSRWLQSRMSPDRAMECQGSNWECHYFQTKLDLTSQKNMPFVVGWSYIYWRCDNFHAWKSIGKLHKMESMDGSLPATNSLAQINAQFCRPSSECEVWSPLLCPNGMAGMAHSYAAEYLPISRLLPHPRRHQREGTRKVPTILLGPNRICA